MFLSFFRQKKGSTHEVRTVLNYNLLESVLFAAVRSSMEISLMSDYARLVREMFSKMANFATSPY